MPRPETREVTFTIDGREVTAPENVMLVDGAKHGDVEIPVFCYEPKLGQPVGACRMCLVEIEGIPKLQTACSTAVKDGMVVHTQTDRVKAAQRAVVEFLLVNHPLDCPVCDKGGECPLQDITYGWGPGTSRFIEPKRHFKKPLELSPLIAIDRERCILCYRCVRFSQEVSEDYQLVLIERGAASFVGTFDGRPYVAPFSGNITELCPVGALTSSTYRFRARPWDIEGSGTICTLCPSQCNVTLTVRDDRVLRVLARDNEAVDDGWLCDKGRYAFQYAHADERIVEPLVREGTQLMPASWEKALARAASALEKAGPKAAALAAGETTNEEAFLLQRLFRDSLGSGNLAASPRDELPVETARALADPRLQATVADLEWAHSILVLDCDPMDDATILDLRIRKGIRRHGVRLTVASAHPTALDSNAKTVLRFAPGSTEGFLVALAGARAGDVGNLGGAAAAAGTKQGDVRAMAEALRDGGEDLVVIASERTLNGPGAAALMNILTRLGVADRAGAGLLLLPESTNERGIREAGFAAGHGPGYAKLDGEGGRDATAIAEGLAGGDLSVLYLLHADPVRQSADRDLWERALGAAQTVIVHESVLTDTVREHADVVFPAEAYPEKEGTVTHFDGRVQRVRQAIGHPRPAGRDTPGAGVRPGWQVITDLAQRTGLDMRVLAPSIASQQLFDAVPFYEGLTLDAIGGRGVRWPEREAAAALGAAEWKLQKLSVPQAAPSPNGALRLGTFRTLWASKEVDVSPALQFARPRQVVELSPQDADRLGVTHGDEVVVRANGHRVTGTAHIRAAIPAGSVFLAEGTRENPANLLGRVQLVEVVGRGGGGGGAPAGVVDPGVEDTPIKSDQQREENAGAGIAQAPAGDVDTHPAEPAPGDQTADAPAGPPSTGSDPGKATGGGATGEKPAGGQTK
jgi:NADH-quinone oxidoreductase subunit G